MVDPIVVPHDQARSAWSRREATRLCAAPGPIVPQIDH